MPSPPTARLAQGGRAAVAGASSCAAATASPSRRAGAYAVAAAALQDAAKNCRGEDTLPPISPPEREYTSRRGLGGALTFDAIALAALEERQERGLPPRQSPSRGP